MGHEKRGWFKAEPALSDAPTKPPLGEREPTARLAAGAPRAGAAERFADLGEIGRGGMSSVHRVVDQDLLRVVAMKVLFPEIAQVPGESRRFVEEAQITAQLDHPHIPAVHEVGVDAEGAHYFTMNYVRGRDLEEILRDENFSVSDGKQLFKALQVFVKVCEAIAFAHSRGVVHCDLKPRNIRVGSHGKVYVMDWGIARVLGNARPGDGESQRVALARAGGRRTRDDGKVMGTLGYMSPEQAAGRNAELDERTDVFALGAVLYRILTGRAPYAAKSEGEALSRAAEARFVPPQEAVGTPLPRRLCAIAVKAMQRSPGDRYQGVDELREDVEDYLRGAGRYPVRVVGAGATLVREGEPGSSAYIIVRGRCVAYKLIEGRRQVLREMGPGELFGEMTLVTGQCRTATVEALEEVGVAEITRESLAEEMGQTLIAGRMLKALAERFREVDERATTMQQEWDANRVAQLVFQHLLFEGEPAAGGARTARWSPLRDELCRRFSGGPDDVLALARRTAGLQIDPVADTVTATRVE